MQNRSSHATSVSTESSSRAREDVAFSFVTSQRPAMLLTVSTFSQQYIAVILARNGTYGFYNTTVSQLTVKMIQQMPLNSSTMSWLCYSCIVWFHVKLTALWTQAFETSSDLVRCKNPIKWCAARVLTWQQIFGWERTIWYEEHPLLPSGLQSSLESWFNWLWAQSAALLRDFYICTWGYETVSVNC